MRLRPTLLALFVLGCAAPARAAPLFEELGGRPGLERIVETATKIWTSDPRTAPTFEETNIPRFKRLLADQLCSVAGGGCVYTGRDMREAHKGLHLGTGQFNALVEDLQTAMDTLGVSFPVQNRLLARLAPMYHDVVTK